MSHCTLAQAFCSAACHWFGVVACKIHSVRMSFALPVCCTGPVVLLVGLMLFITQAEKLEGAQHGSMTGHLSSFLYTRSDGNGDAHPAITSGSVFIAEFCESLALLSKKETNPVILLEITRSICRTSLGRCL